MQFIPLDNFKTMLRRGADFTTTDGTGTPYNFTDISGTSRRLAKPTSTYTIYENGIPFLTTLNVTGTSADVTRIFAYASTDVTISASAYAPTETVGSCSCSTVTNSHKGWIMSITVTGSETKTINSIYFSRKLWYGTANTAYAEALLWAVKLDTPVELNAENNYTANFVFAIEF